MTWSEYCRETLALPVCVCINTDVVPFGTQKFVSQRDLLLSAQQANCSLVGALTLWKALRDPLPLQRYYVKTLVSLRVAKLFSRGAQDFP